MKMPVCKKTQNRTVLHAKRVITVAAVLLLALAVHAEAQSVANVLLVINDNSASSRTCSSWFAPATATRRRSTA